MRLFHTMPMLLACLMLSGCGSGEPAPSEELQTFVVESFGKAMADSRLRAEFDFEPPQFQVKAEDETSIEVDVIIPGVDRVIKGLDVADWVMEKRDRVKGGGRGRIKLARDSGDDGKRTFVFAYLWRNGHWALKDHKCAGRGYVPDELVRYLQLDEPSVAAVQ
jgi:hypothetical protein